MKTTNQALLLTLAALMLGLIAQAATTAADEREGRGRGPHGRFEGARERIEALADELELTTEQRAQIEKVRTEAAPQRIELRKELMRLRHQLRGEMLNEEPDPTAATQLLTRIGDARTKLEILALEERLAIRAVLTPEQRDRLLAGRLDGPPRPRRRP
jgi:Spy/CpxP family protein refolding chaperone